MVLTGDPNRLARAMDQLEVVDGLVTTWRTTIAVERPQSLTEVIAGPDLGRGPYTVHEIRFTAVDEPETRSPVPVWPDSFACEVVLDLNERYLSDDDGRPLSIIVEGDDSGEDKLVVVLPDGTDEPWGLAPRGPDSLTNFAILWDALVSIRSVAWIFGDQTCSCRSDGSPPPSPIFIARTVAKHKGIPRDREPSGSR